MENSSRSGKLCPWAMFPESLWCLDAQSLKPRA
jgi:hypothetical protein